MTEPFDRSKPSPIEQILQLRSHSPGSVVRVNQASDLQARTYVETGLEARLISHVRAESPHLLLLTGSAGGGKSALIENLRRAAADQFECIIEDATHADTPTSGHAALFAALFEPFADGSAAPPGRTRLVAANIGLLIALFDDLRRQPGTFSYAELEHQIFWRLGLIDIEPPPAPWRLTIVNLDDRPTAGQGGLFLQMLRALDPERPDGVLGGAERCGTCTVAAWCPVMANARLASSTASEALGNLAAGASLERGRQYPPRALWDVAARLVTGDDDFDAYDDPCDAAAQACADGDREFVAHRLLPTVLFSAGGDLGQRIAALDPSLRPSEAGHQFLTAAAIRPELAAEELRQLAAGGGDAYLTAAAHIAELDGDTHRAARAGLAAQYLRDPKAWPIHDEAAEAFVATLGEYTTFPDGQGEFPALNELRDTVEKAIAQLFGELVGESVAYVPVEAYDPRDSSLVFARIDLARDSSAFHLPVDDRLSRNPEGTKLVGFQPLEIPVRIAGVRVPVSLPAYRLLQKAAHRAAPAAPEAERFHPLRRAVEALARQAAATDADLLVKEPGRRRLYEVRTAAPLGGGAAVVTVRQVP